MKKLTCEMCGSVDIMKQDGVFVCQTCGCKYSVEEAKKMMIDGTVEVSGVVKIDSSDEIPTYMTIAERAYEAGNFVEAETYCNRIIEIDKNNYAAWLLKGKAAGWQSQLMNLRIDEAIHCFLIAVGSAAETESKMLETLSQEEGSLTIREDVTIEAYEELQRILSAAIELSGDSFIQWPDSEEAERTRTIFMDCVQKMIAFVGATRSGIDVSNAIKPFAVSMNTIACTAYEDKVLKDFRSNPFPNKQEWKSYYESAENVKSLLLQALEGIDLSPNGLEDLSYAILENLIHIEREVKESCSWDYENIDYCRDMPGMFDRIVNTIQANGGIPDPEHDRYWHQDYSFTVEAKEARQRLIDAYIQKQQELRDIMYEQYWVEHAEEKEQLETEREELEATLADLQNQITPLNREVETLVSKRDGKMFSEIERDRISHELTKLHTEQGALGLFKSKEKKEIQAKIDELNARIANLETTIETERKSMEKECNDRIREINERLIPINVKIGALQERINEINSRLAK